MKEKTLTRKGILDLKPYIPISPVSWLKK